MNTSVSFCDLYMIFSMISVHFHYDVNVVSWFRSCVWWLTMITLPFPLHGWWDLQLMSMAVIKMVNDC